MKKIAKGILILLITIGVTIGGIFWVIVEAMHKIIFGIRYIYIICLKSIMKLVDADQEDKDEWNSIVVNIASKDMQMGTKMYSLKF
jgi:hypothetical protein